MKNVILLLTLLAAGLLVAADVFEDFESYADTEDLLAADWVYRPTAWNSDPNSPDGGRATFILNTTDAHTGEQCLETYVGTYDVNYRDWGFRAPDSNNPWDWRDYRVLRFYYKGDVDVRVRIHNQWIPGLVYDKTFSYEQTDEWVPVIADISNISRNLIQALMITVYDRNNQGVVAMFDDFELLEQPMFDGPVDVYYPGTPREMELFWTLTDPNTTPILRYGIDGYDYEVEVDGSLDFNYTIDNLIPTQHYIYEIYANGFTYEGRFAAETFDSDILILENYESYADDEELRASPLTYGPATYGSTTTAYLVDGSFDGEKAVRFDFVAGWGTSVMGGLRLNGAYLMGYDRLRIWYKGHPSNPLSGANPREVTFRVHQDSDIFAQKNVGRVVANDFWDYVEFEIDNSPGSKWSHVTHIVARIDRPMYETLRFHFDRIELIRDFLPPQGDITGDFAVNWDDMSYVVQDWLTDTTDVPEQSVVIEDFEGYESDLDNWSLYYNSTAPSQIMLLETGAYEGSEALQWNYDVETSIGNVFAEILYELDSPIDLSQYDKVRIRVKRYLTNSSESSVYIKFLDSGLTNANLSGKTYLPGATTAATEEWLEWEIDLHNLNYEDGEPDYTQLSDITNLYGIMFGVLGNQGAGRIDMDYIRFVQDPECSIVLEADLTGDCVVNLEDYAIIADQWLLDLLAD